MKSYKVKLTVEDHSPQDKCDVTNVADEALSHFTMEVNVTKRKILSGFFVFKTSIEQMFVWQMLLFYINVTV